MLSGCGAAAICLAPRRHSGNGRRPFWRFSRGVATLESFIFAVSLSPGSSLAVAEPVKLAPSMRVRAKSAARKEELAWFGDTCLCGFGERWRETLNREKELVYSDDPKELAGERQKLRLPKRNEKLPAELPKEKDCLPSVALGCILLLEFGGGTLTRFSGSHLQDETHEWWVTEQRGDK